MIMTDAAVKRLKAPPGQRVEFFDQATSGLALRVAGPTERAKEGRRSWCLFYRNDGKLHRLTIGTYPEIGLQDARVEAAKAQVAKRQGTDPARAKAEAKAEDARAAKQPESVDAVGELWIARELQGRKRAPRYISGSRQNLNNHVLSRWHGRAVRMITRRDIVALLDDVMDHGSSVVRDGKQHKLDGGPLAANRTLSTIRAMLNFAVDRGLIEVNPSLSIKRPGEETKRDRVLTDDEIRAALLATDATDYPYGAFFKLLMLTACRRDEVRTARWRDFDLDAATPTWTLPAETVKSRRTHVLPLAPQAVTLLRSLPRLTVRGADGRRLPSPFVLTIDGPVPFRALADCKRRLDVKIIEMRGEPLAPWTLHDLRRSAASGMAGLGVTEHVIGKVLNHTNQSVTGIYNRHDYFREKADALRLWADHLDTLTPPAANNVVSLKRA